MKRKNQLDLSKQTVDISANYDREKVLQKQKRLTQLYEKCCENKTVTYFL
jgi:hypothetical protein